ncbi:MAG: ribbon-helix-helix domain-containing protein [Candidatus Nanohaloarchaea archaeon]
MADHSTITVPRELREQVEELIEDTGFQNVSEFTRFVLRDIAAQGDFDGPEEFSETEQRVRERLENLGYLDVPEERRSEQRRNGDANLERE